MTTARDIIQDSLELIEVYAPGETASDADYSRGFLVLNALIDAWEDERIFCNTITSISVNLVANQAAYTIGQSGPLRPIGIEYGPGEVTVTFGGTSTLADVVSEIEWNSIYGVNPGTGTPLAVFYDPQFPYGIANFAPTPSGSGTATLPALYQLTGFASLSGLVNLSSGVQDGLRYNLAIALKPYFPTAKLSPEILVLAQETKNFLRYTNRNSRALLGRDRKVALPKQAAPGEQ